MFKWTCLAVAVIFLGLVAWLLNAVRQEIRRSGQIVQTAGETINEHLPAIVEKTRKTTDTLAEQLPEIVEKTRMTTETLAEVAEDIRQLKELAGITATARDQGLVAYATSVLDQIEASGGTIGLKKAFGGSGLKNPVSAKEWVAGARKEAIVLTILANSKTDFVTRLTRNKFHYPWYIQVGAQPPVMLLDWLKANHPATRELAGWPASRHSANPKGEALDDQRRSHDVLNVPARRNAALHSGQAWVFAHDCRRGLVDLRSARSGHGLPPHRPPGRPAVGNSRYLLLL
jgi:hypothetical protein